MIYPDVPAGTTLFVDAGPFIHHFEPNAVCGPASTDMLERIENQDISAVTTTHILSEVAHRLMTLEAMQAYGWKAAGIAPKLRNHPNDFAKVYAETSAFEQKGNCLTRQYLVEADEGFGRDRDEVAE